MDASRAGRVSARAGRALALICLSVIVIAGAGVAYLQATLKGATLAPAGVTATPQVIDPSQVTSDLLTYAFVSPSIGWALDLSLRPPHSSSGDFWIFRTIDGGKHWQKQLYGHDGLNGIGPYSIQFFDRSHGFVFVSGVPDQLQRTTDGGASWTVINLPAANVDEVTFSDPSRGWLLAQTPVSGGQALSIYATNDAGDKWQRLPDPPVQNLALTLRRVSEAWLGSYEAVPPRVYRSTDGGLSWQPSVVPYPLSTGEPWDASVTLLPGIGVEASLSCQCAPTTTFGFTSFDGGVSWKYVPPAPGSFVAHQDDIHWWVIDRKTLYRSSDAGQTWTKVSDGLPDWQFIPHPIDAMHAWAELIVEGGYGLALSDDRGLHWTRATVPHP
jgi:hypothetical protein